MYNHDETAVLVEVPKHLNLKTINGQTITKVYIDDEMVDLIKILWYKYNIPTVGSCKGNKDIKNLKEGVAWIQLRGEGDNKDIYLMIQNVLNILYKEAKFPVLLYDPRCIPNENPLGYMLKRDYDKLVSLGYEINIPIKIIENILT